LQSKDYREEKEILSDLALSLYIVEVDDYQRKADPPCSSAG
jgi:hypothetical protein